MSMFLGSPEVPLGKSKQAKEDETALAQLVKRDKEEDKNDSILTSAIKTIGKSLTSNLEEIRRSTESTSSRLDQNNSSGPTKWIHQIAGWSSEKFTLDIMTETLGDILTTIETSAIARHSDSPLETLMKKQHIEDSKKKVSGGMSVKRSKNDMTPWVNVITRGTEPIAAALAIMLEIVQGHPGIILNNKGPLGKAALDEKEEEVIDKATKEKNSIQKTIGGLFGFFLGTDKKDKDKKTSEDKLEAKKAEKADDIKDDKRNSWLQKIWKNSEGKDRTWFSILKKWGMWLLVGLTALLVPSDWINALLTAPLWLQISTVVSGLALLLFPLRTLGFVIGVLGKLLKWVGKKLGITKLLADAWEGTKNFFSGKKDIPKNTPKSDMVTKKGDLNTGKKDIPKTSKVGKKITKEVGEGIGKKGASKALGKSLLKKIPGIGLLAGLVFAGQKALAGDWTGAGMEAASGAMSTVPLVGTAGSTAMDAAIMARDAGIIGETPEAKKAREAQESTADTNKEIAKTLTEIRDGKTNTSVENAIEKKKKKSDDYVAAHDQGIKVEADYDGGFEGLSKKEKTKLFEFAKKRGVSEKQVRGGYFNYSTLLDRGSIHKDDIGYGGALERAKLKTGMDYRERRKAFKEGGPAEGLPFGHDKSAFKKQTSLGDRFKNLGKWLWGDKKAAEAAEDEPDEMDVEFAKAEAKVMKSGGYGGGTKTLIRGKTAKPTAKNPKPKTFAYSKSWNSPTHGPGMSNTLNMKVAGKNIDEFQGIFNDWIQTVEAQKKLDLSGHHSSALWNQLHERSYVLKQKMRSLEMTDSKGKSKKPKDADKKQSSQFKKQTSLGDRFKNLGKWLWGDEKKSVAKKSSAIMDANKVTATPAAPTAPTAPVSTASMKTATPVSTAATGLTSYKKWVDSAQKDYKKLGKSRPKYWRKKQKNILAKAGRQLRGPNRESLLKALKGTELEKIIIKKTAGGLDGPADLSGAMYDKVTIGSGPNRGIDMLSPDFVKTVGANKISPMHSPKDKMNSLGAMHDENNALKDTQKGGVNMIDASTKNISSGGGGDNILVNTGATDKTNAFDHSYGSDDF